MEAEEEERLQFQRGGSIETQAGTFSSAGATFRFKRSLSSGATTTGRVVALQEPWEKELKSIAWMALPVAVSHPLNYAQFLMQIGFEPIVPRVSTDLFGRSGVYLGSVVDYFKCIYTQDGPLGFVRGLGPSLALAIASVYIHKYVEKIVAVIWGKMRPNAPERTRFPYLTTKDAVGNLIEKAFRTQPALPVPTVPNIVGPVPPLSADDLSLHAFGEDLGKEVASLSLTTAITWPLQVVMLRSMAQFVGKEQFYRYFLGSLGEISLTEGCAGFFRGLAPALCHVVVVTVTSHAIIFLFALSSPQSHQHLGLLRLIVASIVNSVFYPLKLTSRLVAVSGARNRLRAARPPFIPELKRPVNLYFALLRSGQTKRGNALFFRQPAIPLSSSPSLPSNDHQQEIKLPPPEVKRKPGIETLFSGKFDFWR